MLTVTGRLRYDVIRRLWPADVRSVLEIGAGKGALGALLARRCDYTGLEPDRDSYEAARALLGERVLQERDEDFARSGFDLVCAFEVLEHIEDDVGALVRWRTRLRPHGWLMLSVPAGRDRFGRLDEFVGHYRRYERLELQEKLKASGFERGVVVGYGFPLANLVRAISTRVARSSGRSKDEASLASGRFLQPSTSTSWLRRAAAAPFALAQRPFADTDLGTGYVVLSRINRSHDQP